MTPGQKFAWGIVALGFAGVISSPLWRDRVKDRRKARDDWDEKDTHVMGR